ncbi:radical SAM protein [Herbivorax sp. ANBcel31]|uniref:radical SAM/SPASM domain-containing protein n=1 Tax=Herbivorax sp. ANBcel31 TaxID=3069754 RepID=UPI0027AFE219|nr:radical SAM protein [Herbivorax sp. ANBcel31]MDQ2086411.1 radical SAM protein [Herbivorax sp. ANBcel31]
MVTTRYYIYYKLEENKYILLNTLSGAIDIVEKNIIQYLKNPSKVDINKDFVVALKERGYIISKNEDLDKIKDLIKNAKYKSKTGTFVICPTYMCNLRCKYCFEGIGTRTKSKVLEEKDVDKIFKAIEEVCSEKDIKKPQILLYGGEPFLPSTKDIVSYILKKSRNKGYFVSAISNSTHLYQYKDELNEYKNTIKSIQVTIDGSKNIHNKYRVKVDGSGTFDEITKSVDLLLAIGIRVNLRINTGKNNVKYLSNVLEFIEQKKWNISPLFKCQIAPITDHFCTFNLPNWMPESELLKEIYAAVEDVEKTKEKFHMSLGKDIEIRTSLLRSIWREKKKKVINPQPCAAGKRKYYIFGAEGNIYPCPETVGMEEYAIGRYLPSLKLDQEAEKLWERDITNIDKCRECSIAPICGTGCTWACIATNGKNFKEPVCNFARETIDSYFELNKHKILKLCKNSK